MKSSSSSTEGTQATSIWRRWPPLVYLASVSAMLLAWHAIASFFPPAILPGPIPVFGRVAEIFASGRFAVHMGPTLLRVGAGFALAFVVSLALGILMGVNRIAERFFEPEAAEARRAGEMPEEEGAEPAETAQTS